ncbi:MAG: type II toxin-antitoxin system RelE/ParE family toxin [Acidobacteriota bacterium]|nr:type II toxin-antitoxin system RelE/ParE family toxin [Acidobacteriota bacterium]
MDFQIRITEAALAKFEESWSTSGLIFPATAERFVNAILNHVELLRTFLYIGSPVEGRPRIRHLVHTPILIYYRVNEGPNFIEVLHLWHGLRNAHSF